MKIVPGTYFIRFGNESIESALGSYERVSFESGENWVMGYKTLDEAHRARLACISRRQGTPIKIDLLNSDLEPMAGLN